MRQAWSRPDRKQSIWIGFDPREATAFAVARHSILSKLKVPIPVRGLILSQVRQEGLYNRPTEGVDGKLQDVISRTASYNGAMSTEFAISRFLTPQLASSGWAIFMDCDVLMRADPMELFAACDPEKAVMVVKHQYAPPEGLKMDAQAQTNYNRKNWSSVMAFNCDHPSTKKLTVALINSIPGRDLHRFCWLDDDEIGELHPRWNWLVGHSSPQVEPAIVHFTEGGPWFPGYENVPYADEWRSQLVRWAL